MGKTVKIRRRYMAARRLVRSDQDGVALIFILLIMVILVTIVGEFSYSMRTEVNITRNFREEEEAYRLALAGIESAKMEILSAENPADMYVNEDGILVFNQESGEDEETVPERKDSLGRGSFEYTITDEDGKLNINNATIDQLKELFIRSGVGLKDIDTIVDSIIDWRDTNDLHMLNGAEEDYYNSLEKPYSCKDGPFDSIEELLLVKGITPEIFFGSAGNENEETESEEKDVYEGVSKYLTVKGTNKVNLNTASEAVLEVILGPDVAYDILLQRENGPISNPTNKGKVSSSFFSVISTGSNADGKIKRSVKAILEKRENKMETVYWNDNFIG